MKTPLLTEAKLVSAVHYMKNRIAPVPDGISVEVLKVVTTCYTQLLVHVYNECLAARIFPAQWKLARLELISKGINILDSLPSYRPLCMLDIAGKVIEKLPKLRLQIEIRAAGDLPEQLHGLQRGSHTIRIITLMAEAARRGKQRLIRRG